MGTARAAEPAKLIASIIYREERHFVRSLELLVDRWGGIDLVSETLAFDYTDYYEKEMGTDLQRRVVSFRSLIDPGRIVAIKGRTNEVEEVVSSRSPYGRAVNIDPGYVSGYHLFLATTKAAPHRPYLRKGIYADLTLIFQEKRFHALPWTYPDYQSEKMIAIFCAIRKKYLFQRKHQLCAR